MVLNVAVLVSQDALKDLHERADGSVDARFLKDLATEAFHKRFSRFERSARQRPQPLLRLTPSANQQHTIPLDHDAGDSDDRPFGIAPSHQFRFQHTKRQGAILLS